MMMHAGEYGAALAPATGAFAPYIETGSLGLMAAGAVTKGANRLGHTIADVVAAHRNNTTITPYVPGHSASDAALLSTDSRKKTRFA